ARSQAARNGALRRRSPASITTRQSGEATGSSASTAAAKLRPPAFTQTARRLPNSGMVVASSTSRVGSPASASPSKRTSENGSAGSSTAARTSASARSRTRPASWPNTSTTGCAGLGLATKASICGPLRATITCFSSVRLALRVDDGFELAEHAHAGQQLREAAVGLAFLLDRGDEFAVLELDAVHRHVDLGHVDLVVLAVGEVVVERLVGAVVADVAEERAERPVIVERQRQREDRAGRRARDDAHVHRDIELRMDRPL